MTSVKLFSFLILTILHTTDDGIAVRRLVVCYM